MLKILESSRVEIERALKKQPEPEAKRRRQGANLTTAIRLKINS